MNIVVPSDFDAAIKETEVVRQKQDQYEFLLKSTKIQGETLVLEEEIEQSIQVSAAAAVANATLTELTAKSVALINALQLEADAASTSQEYLQLRGNGGFYLGMFWIRLLERKMTAGTVVSFLMDNPI